MPGTEYTPLMKPMISLLLGLCAGCSADTDELPNPRLDAPMEDAGQTDDCSGGPVCFVDFPCRGATMCASDDSVQDCRTVPCEEACGTPCCSGAGCAPLEITTCRAGTSCYQNVATLEASYGQVEARCLTSSMAASLGWVAPTGSAGWGCQ